MQRDGTSDWLHPTSVLGLLSSGPDTAAALLLDKRASAPPTLPLLGPPLVGAGSDQLARRWFWAQMTPTERVQLTTLSGLARSGVEVSGGGGGGGDTGTRTALRRLRPVRRGHHSNACAHEHVAVDLQHVAASPEPSELVRSLASWSGA